MASKHIAFVLEQAYGHIIPTLGIASELLRRGHRVSYAVTSDFAPAILRLGAHAEIIQPLETRTEICQMTALPNGGHDYSFTNPAIRRRLENGRKERTDSSLAQLEERYEQDRPDVLVRDDCLDVAGKALAEKWELPSVRVFQNILAAELINKFLDDRLILIPVPKFFNRDIELFDDRFAFLGFIPEGRAQIAEPWPRQSRGRRTILAAPSTGLLAQVDFCRMVISAFRGSDYTIVLSVPGDLDPLSAIDDASIGDLPGNFWLNRHSSHLEILESACLFIGQGGPSSTLEALYSGVPAVLIPPTQGHDLAASRVAELGLGLRLSIEEASPERLMECALTVIDDNATLLRVTEAQSFMKADSGARTAADLIESQIRS